MDVNYFILMALHVIGVLLHLQMFVNCFEEKYAVVSIDFMFLMMYQCFNQLQFLLVNALETTNVFSNEQGQDFYTYNSALMITFGSLMNCLPLLILAGCYRTVSAVYGTSTVAIILVAGNFLVVYFTSEEILALHFFRVAALPCMFLLVVMLRVLYVATWRDESGFLQSLVIILVLLVFVSSSRINLEVIRHRSLQNIEFFQRIFFLYVLCIIVGVLLPLLFQRMLDSVVLLLATEKDSDVLLLATEKELTDSTTIDV